MLGSILTKVAVGVAGVAATAAVGYLVGRRSGLKAAADCRMFDSAYVEWNEAAISASAEEYISLSERLKEAEEKLADSGRQMAAETEVTVEATYRAGKEDGRSIAAASFELELARFGLEAEKEILTMQVRITQLEEELKAARDRIEKMRLARTADAESIHELEDKILRLEEELAAVKEDRLQELKDAYRSGYSDCEELRADEASDEQQMLDEAEEMAQV